MWNIPGSIPGPLHLSKNDIHSYQKQSNDIKPIVSQQFPLLCFQIRPHSSWTTDLQCLLNISICGSVGHLKQNISKIKFFIFPKKLLLKLSLSQQKSWHLPYLFSFLSHSMSNLQGNTANSTFKIYMLISDLTLLHCSPLWTSYQHLPPKSLQYLPVSLLLYLPLHIPKPGLKRTIEHTSKFEIIWR